MGSDPIMSGRLARPTNAIQLGILNPQTPLRELRGQAAPAFKYT
jgi:hypothetical protein